MNIEVPVLSLVTDRKRCGGRPIEDIVDQAVSGGVNLVQLREKDLSSRELLTLSIKIRAITSGRALLFINDRVDIAMVCNADGVQLGEEGLPIREVRKLVGKDMLIGRSVHSITSAETAQENGADLLVVGTIFETASHPEGTLAGLSLIEEITRTVVIPIVGIGGITEENASDVVKSGAKGIATITSISLSPNPEYAAQTLMSELEKTWLSD